MKWCVLITLLLSVFVNGASFYVSPTGSGSGTIQSPWNITTALTNSAVLPGDTIWLRGGTYGVGSNVFICNIDGSSGSPIVIRQYPGERAIIDGGIDADNGTWTTFWGFEITCSNARTNAYADRPAALQIGGVGQKAINLVIHDSGHPAIASYQNEGAGREIHGCIIWGCGIYELGFQGDTSGNITLRGAGMYLQNKNGTISVSDNISSRNFTSGMKAYAQDGYVNGFTFDGNITWKNSLAGIEVECINNSITNLTVSNNQDYRSFKNAMGYFSNDINAIHYGLVYTNNYQTTYPDKRLGALWLKRWQSVNVLWNTIITTSKSNEWFTAWPSPLAEGGSGNFVELYPITNSMSYIINNNVYHGGVELTEPYLPFRYKIYEPELSFQTWTNTHGFDLQSSYTTNLPTSNVVILRTNKYELGRAHIAVFNWESNSTVSVDISSIGLGTGQLFEVRDAQNYLGTPVFTTNYNVAQPTISLPLTMTNVNALTGGIDENKYGYGESPNVHTASLFNVFVILSAASEAQSGVINAVDANVGIIQLAQ